MLLDQQPPNCAVFFIAAENGMLHLNCLGENICCIRMERLGILTPQRALKLNVTKATLKLFICSYKDVCIYAHMHILAHHCSDLCPVTDILLVGQDCLSHFFSRETWLNIFTSLVVSWPVEGSKLGLQNFQRPYNQYQVQPTIIR